MSADSGDWLANGLHWCGVPIPASYRPPGLPLVIALLHSLQALALLPYLNFAMLGLAAVLLHCLVRDTSAGARIESVKCPLRRTNLFAFGSLWGRVAWTSARASSCRLVVSVDASAFFAVTWVCSNLQSYLRSKRGDVERETCRNQGR